MRTYETMLLLDARRDDAELQQALEKFSSLITDRGGDITATDRWGRRRLAYEIDDVFEGYYAIVTYTLEANKRREVDEALPFIEGFMRAKTVVPAVRTRTP